MNGLRDYEMKKLSVTVLIVGAFAVYSFVHAHSSDALLTPKTASTVSSAVSTATAQPTTAGAPPDASRTPTIAYAPSQASTATSTAAAGATRKTSAPTRTATSSAPTATATTSGRYNDGAYTGSAADAQWGIIQVQAIISGGQITDVQFLQYPNHRSRSVRINESADPKLKSEALQAQSAQVHIVTGATDSSEAFIQSLSDALSQAQS